MNKDQLVKNASYASVATGVLILFVKLWGAVHSSSVSLLASLVDSMLDVTSSIVNMLAVRAALSPPDSKHRFGHNKIEDLVVFGQGVIFIISGSFALYVAVSHILLGQHIQNSETALNSILICTILTLILISYQSYVVGKTNSQLIKSDRIHYISDLGSDLAVIISLYASQYFHYVDYIFGIIIALYIMSASIGLLRQSIRNLIDEEFSDEDREKVLEVLRNDSNVLDVHDMKTRYAGNKAFIQFHIGLDPSISLIKAHDIADKIEAKLQEIFPESEVMIHQDPLGYDKHVQYKEDLRRNAKN
ncbi:cation transporter [Candidatus Phycorickettsia trachydisci]|uniref:Protein p34 n=1 Tax=Candidatus Phycorickettsia trachydisci TaxID=2115978 RepID=A0A2P1P6U1_9RICK|nr:cation diffusion facilitator family transporter [Candidatus Phycorickettsia trachydisci]AVP86992.1 cation transporter [Candidatus Phycorickettsia trachydisci]